MGAAGAPLAGEPSLPEEGVLWDVPLRRVSTRTCGPGAAVLGDAGQSASGKGGEPLPRESEASNRECGCPPTLPALDAHQEGFLFNGKKQTSSKGTNIVQGRILGSLQMTLTCVSPLTSAMCAAQVLFLQLEPFRR